MEGLRRKQTELGEAIDALDAKLAESQGDLGRAFASLGETEIAFVAAEVQKCLENPRYYLENYHFIRTKKLGLVPLWPFWDAQEVFMASFERQMTAGEAIRIIALKARQLGITSISVSLMCWLAFFHPNSHVLSMSDEEDRTDVNFNMARTAWDNLPWWMRPEKRYDIRGTLLGFDRAKESERRISLGLQSQIYFESANQPSGAAYSKSLFGAHLAEVSRYRNANPITEGIFGSLVELPNSIGIMESTARGRGGAWHRICKASETGSLPWDFVFIEWFREPGYCITVPEAFERTQDEAALCKKVKEGQEFELTDGQLVWRRKKMSEFEATDGDSQRFFQEFPVNPTEAFVASGRTAFSKKRLQDMLTHFCRTPNWIGEIRLEADDKTPRLSRVEDGRLHVWEFPKPGEVYYIGADPSMGVEGGDPACAQVVCIPDEINKPIRQVAEWHGWIGPGQFARVLAAIGYLYNTAEISPECNTITTVVSDLCKVIMYPKWYRWMREDKARNMYSNFIGWQTTFRNKNELLGRFRSALDEWTVIIRSEADVDEMFDFVEVEEGSERYEARIGAHDDRTMALLIAYYCATQLRPRMDGTLEENKPPSDQDWANTEFSPIYDNKDDLAQDRTGVPDFFML